MNRHTVSRAKKILIEEININFHYKFGGGTLSDNILAALVKKEAFGTYSDIRIAELKPAQLRDGLRMVRKICALPTKKRRKL